VNTGHTLLKAANQDRSSVSTASGRASFLDVQVCTRVFFMALQLFPCSCVQLYTVSQKISEPLTCYNCDTHNPITINFGRRVTEKVGNQTILCFPTSHTWCFCITLRNRKRRRQRTAALCIQQSPSPAALSTSFLLNRTLWAERIDYMIWEVIQHRECES